jgi:hypothetical protein
MSDDELTDEQQRKMAAALLGSATRKTTIVETRRSGRKPPPTVEIETKLIPLDHGGDDAFTFTFTSIMPDGRRIHLKTIRGSDRGDVAAIVRQYQDEGRLVKWVGTLPEEYYPE